MGTQSVQDKNQKRLGIGCVRVSTNKQERSIKDQKEEIRKEATRENVEMLEGDYWCKDEAISGSDLDRPGLRKLFDYCRRMPEITDVYFWKRNRVARPTDPLDGLLIEREIEKLGKRIHFISGFPKTGNKMIDIIAGAVEYAEAGRYLINLSSDTIRGQVPVAKDGFNPGRPTPYGYDRMVVNAAGQEEYRVRNLGNGIRHKIYPDGKVQVYENGTRPAKDKTSRSVFVLGDPVRIEVVRRIFKAYTRREKGLRAVVEEFNVEGIPSPRGLPWCTSTVRAILSNPAYYGVGRWNVRSFSKYFRIEGGTAVPIEQPDGKKVRFNDPKDWIVSDKDVPAIITKDLFDLVQPKRQSRNSPFARGKSITAPYYLSGLAQCRCGYNLQGETKKSGKKKGYRRYHYYKCSGYTSRGSTVCTRYHLPKDVFEKPVIFALNRRVRDFARIENIRREVKSIMKGYASPKDGMVEEFREKIAEVDGQMVNWKSAIAKGVQLDVAVAELNALTKRKEALEGELAKVRQQKAIDIDIETASREIMAGLDRLQGAIVNGATAEVKAILRGYIGRIDYDPETNRARVGFLTKPTRALLSTGALDSESARISMVAGACSSASGTDPCVILYDSFPLDARATRKRNRPRKQKKS